MIVYVVTDAVGIGVRCTVTTTDAEGVELVAVAVAVSFGDVRTSALVDGARSVQMPHSWGADTVVYVVTDAVGIGVHFLIPATDAEGIGWFSVTVAVSFRDV